MTFIFSSFFQEDFWSTALKTLITVSTIILLGLIVAYHSLEVQVSLPISYNQRNFFKITSEFSSFWSGFCKGVIHKWRHGLRGEGGQGFCDNSTNPWTMKGGGRKMSKITWRHLWTTIKLILKAIIFAVWKRCRFLLWRGKSRQNYFSVSTWSSGKIQSIVKIGYFNDELV